MEVDAHDFGEYVTGADLVELRSKGCYFTWTNNQLEDSRIWRRLDMCFVNIVWLDLYTLSEFEALPAGLSDHSPNIVNIRMDNVERNVPFRFFNMWMSHPSFFGIIREVWHRNINGSNMFRLWKKIEAAKRGIKEAE